MERHSNIIGSCNDWLLEKVRIISDEGNKSELYVLSLKKNKGNDFVNFKRIPFYQNQISDLMEMLNKTFSKLPPQK